jgi:hypothetical protein
MPLAPLVALLFMGYGRGHVVTELTVAVIACAFAFDNLVILVPHVRRLGRGWQYAYLLIGPVIALAVQVVVPALLVALAAWQSPASVFGTMFRDSAHYSEMLLGVHPQIVAFGFAFLILNATDNVTDDSHTWIRFIEAPLQRFGGQVRMGMRWVGIPAVLIAGSLSFSWTFLAMGMLGILLFSAVDAQKKKVEKRSAATGGRRAFGLVELLEAGLSFDLMVGAYAISTNIIDVVAGVLAGVLVIRMLTLRAARGQGLDELVHLAAGASYSMGALAVVQLSGLWLHFPDWVDEVAGSAFLVAALAHSVIHNRRAA